MRFVAYFLRQLVVANASLTREIVTRRDRIRTGIIAVPMEEGISDGLLAFLANVTALTPGTMPIEVQRDPPRFYVHVLHLHDVEAVRKEVRRMENEKGRFTLIFLAADEDMNAPGERAKAEVGYTPTYFLRMLSELGPLETARKLLHDPTVSDGFANLWDRGRLDLTVEALVLRPEFSSLFTDQELDRARGRLKQFE